MSDEYGFTCPTGGQWYACKAGSRFVGCCTEDPCTNGCFQGNIRAGGFNISTFGNFPDASCGSASDFFTCTAGSSFWGCCKSNPCAATPAATCPQGDLVPAFMERPEQFAAYALEASPQKNSHHGAAIGGGVSAGILVTIVGVLLFVYGRKKKRNPHGSLESATPTMTETHAQGPSAQFTGQSPPPTYSSPTPDVCQASSMKIQRHQHNLSSAYQSYGYRFGGRQELAAELTPVEYSHLELPAEASFCKSKTMISELQADGMRAAAELESPQTEYSTDLAKQMNQNTEVKPDRDHKEKT